MSQQEIHQQHMLLVDDIKNNYPTDGAKTIALRHNRSWDYVRKLAEQLNIRRDPHLLRKEQQQSAWIATHDRTPDTFKQISRTKRRQGYYEHQRLINGRPQQTKMHLSHYTHSEQMQHNSARKYLRKLGYNINVGGYTAYYNDNTTRHLNLEQKYNNNYHFKFKPQDDGDTQQHSSR